MTPAMMRAMGKRIKWARELVYRNRSEFARVMEIDVSTIRKLEDGTRAASVKLLDRIIHSLRISYDYVMTGSLSGVDGELALRLVEDHPELRPQLAQRLGIGRIDSLGGTSHAPTIRGILEFVGQ